MSTDTLTTTERPLMTPERAATLAALHLYVAHELAAFMVGKERVEISGRDLLAELTSRATDEAKNCGEWPREPLHLRLCLIGARGALRALGVNAKRIRRRTANGKGHAWCWRLRNDALSGNAEPNDAPGIGSTSPANR